MRWLASRNDEAECECRAGYQVEHSVRTRRGLRCAQKSLRGAERGVSGRAARAGGGPRQEKIRKEDILPRELIDTGSDKRFVRRDEKGQFKESDDVGRAAAQDQKRRSNTKPKRGEGDKGDR